MTFLSSLAARSVRASIEDPARPLTDPTLITLFESGKVAAGVTVTPEKSLGVMAVWRAVNLIAGTCASLPLHAYEQDGDARKRRATGPAATLLATPHPDLTSFELWETVFAHVALWGNAYLWKLRDQSGQIRELWPIHPARVKVGRTSDGGKKFFEVDGEPETEKNILHIPGVRLRRDAGNVAGDGGQAGPRAVAGGRGVRGQGSSRTAPWRRASCARSRS
ncbi:MAG: phage portal protein [bacterium]|nr:phage portal protein [bacterium]